MSIPPKVATAFSTAAATSASSRTSTTSGSARPPASSIARAAVWIVPGSLGWGSAVFAATTTLAPSRAARSAIARPMPRLAPVMKSVRLRRDMARLRPGRRTALWHACRVSVACAALAVHRRLGIGLRDMMRAGLPVDILAVVVVVLVAAIAVPWLDEGSRRTSDGHGGPPHAPGWCGGVDIPGNKPCERPGTVSAYRLRRPGRPRRAEHSGGARAP